MIGVRTSPSKDQTAAKPKPAVRVRDRDGSRVSIRRHLLAGLLIVLLLGGGVGGWASTTQLAGAVIAPGSIVVDSHVKKVQHPTGGIVGKLFVRDGDHVTAGQLLVQLDETVIRANLAIVTKALNELYARQARLDAERDGADSITFPPQLLARANDPSAASAIAGERNLFESRRAARMGKKAQLNQQIGQLQEEINGLNAQQSAKTKEIALIQKELAGVRDLYAKKLVPLTRLIQLERESTRLDGERAQLTAAVAAAQGKISEIKLQIIQVDQDLSKEVATTLPDIESKIGEFIERKVAAEDQLKRTDIRAPQDGTVFQLTVHTVGGVITAGEPIMLIVPDGDDLQVEAKVAPQFIEQVRVGQSVMLRFSALDIHSTPEIDGVVTRISADTSVDKRTGDAYYTIRASLPARQLEKLHGVKLLPGMPVEAFVQSGERTVISYLMKPLRDQFMRAFRER
jgi:HlyD family secretion protein